MLGIWHGGVWLKERFGSTQSMVGWYMEVLDLVGICICYYALILIENNEHKL